MKSFSTAILWALAFASGATSFVHNSPNPATTMSLFATKDGQGEISRSSFVTGTLGALATLTAPPAFARGVKDANLDGAESVANAKACQDRCLYECIKEGGKKAECGKKCAETCSTAKGQISSFTPGK